MTWLGYMSTTGLSSMDYRITDAALDPPGSSEAFHSEKLLRIESSACFQPAAESPEVNPLPALDGRPFTFGSLNNPAKITPAAIDAWAAILRGTPASRLVIAGLPERVQAQMKEQFGSRGIGAERIRLVAPLPLGEFLRLHHEIDLALDTFPYNGGTTSLHAMWMGVPVVSLAGVLPVERAGVSMLGGFGIPQFAAFDWEQYVAVAVRAAEDLESLNAVRQSLRDRMGSVMVRQAAGMTKSLEAALKTTFKASLDRANLEDSH
jgi:predicted O-linked N-acetylglucosamine transferase (SPINDLY family)